MAPDEDAVDLFVTLVHGTWGRGFIPDFRLNPFSRRARWFEAEGAFRERLSRELREIGIRHRTDAVIWSGSNSIRERDLAARQLAKRIRSHRRTHPHARHLVVGHSHGGNVALRALHHLQGEVPDILIATLATPFMLADPRESSEGERRVIQLTNLVAIVTAVAWVFFVFLAEPSEEFWIEGLLIAIIVAGIILRMSVSGSSRSARMRMTAITDLTLRFWTGKEHLLVLRSIDDEAALSLAAGSIANRLSHVLMRLLLYVQIFIGLGMMPIVGLIALVVFDDDLVVVLGLFSYEVPPPTEVVAEIALDFIVMLLIPALAASLAFILIDGAWKSVFGRELVFGSLLIDIDSSSSPDTHCDVEVRTLRQVPEAMRGLRHSLYEHPQAAPAVATWACKAIRSAYMHPA
jgi:hypothetical protein